jgi:uncharacterized iron-regulated protein
MVCYRPGRPAQAASNGRPQQQEYDEMSVKHGCDCREQSIVASSDCDVKASRRPSRAFAFLAAALLVVGLGTTSSAAQTNAACATYGNWIDGTSGNAVDRNDLARNLADSSAVVLLGESHTSPDHHILQMQLVAALHSRRPDDSNFGERMVLGFESFPRRLQGVLDDWVAGKLSAEAFLNAVEWRRVWGYDSALYMPLFQFARLNRIPMVALNVERSLVSRVGREGWAAVPPDAREGLTDPAPANEGYLRELAAVAAMKRTMPPGGGDSQSAPSEPDDAAIAEVMKQPDFKRFVEAQQTWDRAFAQGIVDARRKYPNATIVAVLGSGHVAYGYGVQHQLKDLGMKDAVSLIPVPVDTACTRVGKSFANAMFTLPPGGDEAPTVERPRLGVELVQGEGAPRVNRVVGNSVAEAAGLKAGDHVVRAAGVEMRSPDDLVDVIGRQAPGTWLPLSVRRDGQEIEVVAKFLPRPRQG